MSRQPSGYVDFSNQEQITMETPISSDNKGYKLLQKMGWKAGTGLGRNGTGRIDPILISTKSDIMGLGRRELEDEWSEKSTAQRKKLETEVELTQEVKEKRMRRQAQKESIQKEVEAIVRPFYCELCDKQYTNVAQFDTHLSSYDHNHKKRMRETKLMDRKYKFSKVRKRKQREERRERKRLKQLQDANAPNKAATRQNVVPNTTTQARTSAPQSSFVSATRPPEPSGFYPEPPSWLSEPPSSYRTATRPPEPPSSFRTAPRPPEPPSSYRTATLPPEPPSSFMTSRPPEPSPPNPTKISFGIGSSKGANQPKISFGFNVKK